jgi:hypothetical protein
LRVAYLYLIHGLVLSLPFRCDRLAPAEPGLFPDVVVAEDPVPRALQAPAATAREFDASEDLFLYRGGRRSARFLVRHGETIVFERNPRWQADLFEHHLLYPVMAAVLRQRRLLVLHASCAVGERGAVLVAGEPGAGKSTTVARLVAEGFQLHSDDVSALRVVPQGHIEVLPGIPQLHLHDEAADRLPFETRGLVRHSWHRDKMAVPVAAVSRSACAVYRIVHIGRHAGQGVRVTGVTGRDRLPLLLRCLYGPVLMEQILGNFDLLSHALCTADMFSIERPIGEWSLDAVVDAIAYA